MKAYGTVAAWLHCLLTLMLRREWPGLLPGRFTTGERILYANLTGDRVGPSAGKWKLWGKIKGVASSRYEAWFLGCAAVA
jgi:hypothetical protein